MPGRPSVARRPRLGSTIPRREHPGTVGGSALRRLVQLVVQYVFEPFGDLLEVLPDAARQLRSTFLVIKAEAAVTAPLVEVVPGILVVIRPVDLDRQVEVLDELL